MSDKEESLRTAKRKVADLIMRAVHTSNNETIRLDCLERAVEAQREAARLYVEIEEARPPCRMCGRKVASPCNDAEGYYEGGPWDFACEPYVRGERKPVTAEVAS